MRTLQPGSTLGRYTIVRRIGAGGMAELHLARTRGTAGFEKAAAIKVIHPHLVDDPQSIRMFMREAKIAAELDHPNIVAVLDFGCDAGEYYLAMEYVHGLDLRDVRADLPRGEPLPMACALTIVTAVADALHFAHTAKSRSGEALQIVHRDVSPSNIMLGYGGAVKLGDFGIAKFASHGTGTGTGVIKGKPGYMAPEQCLGTVLDARCDVFSLGIVLYELTTGQRAFAALNPAASMNRVLEGDYVPPEAVRDDYPPALARIVHEAMATHAEERTPSAGELASRLRAYALEAGITLAQASVAQWLTERFGDTRPPSLELEAVRGDTDLYAARARDHATEVTETTEGLGGLAPAEPVDVAPMISKPRSRATGVLLGAGGLGLGVALGLMIAATPSDMPAAVDEVEAAKDTVPEVETKSAPEPKVEPVAVSETKVETETQAETETPAETETEATAAPTPATNKAKRKKKRAKVRPRRDDKPSDEAIAKAREKMFPGSAPQP